MISPYLRGASFGLFTVSIFIVLIGHDFETGVFYLLASIAVSLFAITAVLAGDS